MRLSFSLGMAGLAMAVLSGCGGPAPVGGFNAGSGEYARHLRTQEANARPQIAGGGQAFPGQLGTQSGSIGQEAVAAVRGGNKGRAVRFPTSFRAAPRKLRV